MLLNILAVLRHLMATVEVHQVFDIILLVNNLLLNMLSFLCEIITKLAEFVLSMLFTIELSKQFFVLVICIHGLSQWVLPVHIQVQHRSSDSVRYRSFLSMFLKVKLFI